MRGTDGYSSRGVGVWVTYDIVNLIPLSLVQLGKVVPGRRTVRRELVDTS